MSWKIVPNSDGSYTVTYNGVSKRYSEQFLLSQGIDDSKSSEEIEELVRGLFQRNRGGSAIRLTTNAADLDSQPTNPIPPRSRQPIRQTTPPIPAGQISGKTGAHIALPLSGRKNGQKRIIRLPWVVFFIVLVTLFFVGSFSWNGFWAWRHAVDDDANFGRPRHQILLVQMHQDGDKGEASLVEVLNNQGLVQLIVEIGLNAKNGHIFDVAGNAQPLDVFTVSVCDANGDGGLDIQVLQRDTGARSVFLAVPEKDKPGSFSGFRTATPDDGRLRSCS